MNIPLKVYEVQCTGIPVGYLTINEETEWGKLALKEINGLGGLIWLIPKDSESLRQYINKECNNGLGEV
jgi:hypothetical protein